MSLLPRKGLLAIAAVVDVALNARDRPVSAKALAARHGLPPRHLEPVLQALVHDGILRGVRGPHGGYALARERDHIGIDEIVRVAATVRDEDDDVAASPLIADVVSPAVAEAERAFSGALSRINVDDLARRVESGDEHPSSAEIDFTI
ncbi:MAG: Rrf2 family transcriptional regulator [Hyphomicrobiales bacterium]|nr:Rrf2 family transcriptional regulator [Hyphomicrobiales bacterium]MBV8824219.1 Rrf2 family transcriptional regulator [Hyphomicrobiales bacterium]MBV9429251.1 Rrf2 family transcriptional regulator [Bradyrhizobiaceae bacterium]